jgi:hypothetical protein
MIQVRPQRILIEDQQPVTAGAGVDRLDLINQFGLAYHGAGSETVARKTRLLDIGEAPAKRSSDNTFGRWMPCFLIPGLLAAACSSGPPTLGERPTAPPPRLVESDRDATVRSAATQELGPETASSMPPIEPAKLAPPDPGAVELVRSIASSSALAATESGVTRIRLASLRNFSHSTATEFESMKLRLASLLSEAGEELRLEFLADDTTADYDLTGSAYLVAANGFDLWEMFLYLKPVSSPVVAWESLHPVRLFRQPATGPVQLLVVPENH